jgi:hypothetical protein
MRRIGLAVLNLPAVTRTHDGIGAILAQSNPASFKRVNSQEPTG